MRIISDNGEFGLILKFNSRTLRRALNFIHDHVRDSSRTITNPIIFTKYISLIYALNSAHVKIDV